MDYKFSDLKIGVKIAGLRFPKNFVSSRAWSRQACATFFTAGPNVKHQNVLRAASNI